MMLLTASLLMFILVTPNLTVLTLINYYLGINNTNNMEVCHDIISSQRGNNYPDSKVYGANMGPTWGRQDPGGPHVGSMNLAI